MKVGSKVRCVRSEMETMGDIYFFTEGKEYEVLEFAVTNVGEIGIIISTDDGEPSPAPLVMDGHLWTFEEVI